MSVRSCRPFSSSRRTKAGILVPECSLPTVLAGSDSSITEQSSDDIEYALVLDAV